MLIPSVVVHDLKVCGPNFSQCEADAPLVIDADAVLTLPVVSQRLQVIARCCLQKGQCLRGPAPAYLVKRACFKER